MKMCITEYTPVLGSERVVVVGRAGEFLANRVEVGWVHVQGPRDSRTETPIDCDVLDADAVTRWFGPLATLDHSEGGSAVLLGEP